MWGFLWNSKSQTNSSFTHELVITGTIIALKGEADIKGIIYVEYFSYANYN